MKNSSKNIFRKVSSVVLASALMLGTTAVVSNVFGGATGITANAEGDVTSASDLSNDSTLSSESIRLGEKVSVITSASGGTGNYSYSAIARHEDDEEWAEINIAEFCPDKTGNYYVKITVTDDTGKIRGDADGNGYADVVDVTVIQKVLAGRAVPYFDEMAADVDGNGLDITDATLIQMYAAGRSNPYNIGEPIVNTADVTKELVVESAVDPLVNTSTVSAKNVLLGKATTITCAAEGGTEPYTYEVLYKKSTDTNWAFLYKRGSAAEVTFKPKKAVKYNICVRAYDSEDSCAKKYFNINVIGMSVSINSAIADNSDTPILVAPKVPVTVKVVSEGVDAPFRYAVFYKKATDTQWACAQDFDTNNEVSFKPARQVLYDVCIKTKDSNGQIVKHYYKIDVRSVVKVKAELSADEIVKGEAVTVTYSASNGTEPYTYRVLYKKATDEKFAVVQDFSESTTATLKPSKAPLYDIRVVARDSKGDEGFVDLQVVISDFES